MKIKNVACTQFAGVLSKDVKFDDGVNIIYGNNEAGKSTIVNLISSVLFQNSKLDSRKEGDKNFKNKYFPSSVKNSDFNADFADGSIVFDIDGEEYKLNKDWGEGAGATLTTPFGIIRDEKKINEILKEKLIYGEGVYNDMLFSSQYNMASSLKKLLDNSKKDGVKQEITDALTRAFVEGDDASIDEIESAIIDKINKIRGAHWDEDRQAPQRRSTRWVNGIGEIMKAYYDLEDANISVQKIKELEDNADFASSEYEKISEKLNSLEQKVATLEGFASVIKLNKEYQKSKQIYLEKLNKIDFVANNWAKCEKDIKRAKELEKEKVNRLSIDLLDIAKKIKENINSIDESLLNRPCPENAELESVDSAKRKIDNMRNKMCAMNLCANVKMLGGNKVEIRSISTNELIELDDFSTEINEAVRIVIPNVMEMTLAPKDVDVDYFQKEIDENNKIIDDVFKKYDVRSIEELNELYKNIINANNDFNILNQKLNMLLGDIKYDELVQVVDNIEGEVRTIDAINSDVYALCGSDELQKFITSKQTILDGYIDEYENVDKLKSSAFDTTKELESVNKKLSESGNIPDELKNIDDPEEYLNVQKQTLKALSAQREEAIKNKAECVSKLEIYMANIVGDARENVNIATKKFEEQKELLACWENIYKVFLAQKENINNSPFDDIADSFTKYLGIISDGRVESQFPNKDKLQMDIYSNNHLVDYDKLSQGTKETVSLAFRLAVIDHLFPDGNSVAVFDDPFTDMDDNRTKKSCELIKEFSKKNQVIILTCKDECVKMLDGNLIKM